LFSANWEELPGASVGHPDDSSPRTCKAEAPVTALRQVPMVLRLMGKGRKEVRDAFIAYRPDEDTLSMLEKLAADKGKEVGDVLEELIQDALKKRGVFETDRRRARRKSAAIPVVLELKISDTEIRYYTGKITNISMTGARIAFPGGGGPSDDILEQGEEIDIMFAMGEKALEQERLVAAQRVEADEVFASFQLRPSRTQESDFGDDICGYFISGEAKDYDALKHYLM
jgi:hypothetical protein